MNRNAKVFKFPRKEMQVSDEINKKKQDGTAIDPPKPKDTSKEKMSIVIEREPSVPECREGKERTEGRREVSEGGRREMARMSEQGVLFDKKLTKLSLPDHIEKVKFVGKIQNKLLSCLEKKKALLPMKKLVKLDILSELLGKKQRKLVTDRPHFVDTLDVEAPSMKKHEERSGKVDSKCPPQPNLPPVELQEDPRMRMKVMPLRVPAIQQDQPQLCFFSQEDPFEVVQDCKFFSEEDTIFDCSGQEKLPISFQEGPKGSLFEERKSSFIKRQAQSTFFANINEYSFNENHFNSQRRPSHPLFHESQSELDIGKLRLPREERRSGSQGFGIFAIEEENSHFFSPEKQKEQNRRQGGQRGNPEHFWKGNESSSGRSDEYY